MQRRQRSISGELTQGFVPLFFYSSLTYANYGYFAHNLSFQFHRQIIKGKALKNYQKLASIGVYNLHANYIWRIGF
jgi:hypothetical protein